MDIHKIVSKASNNAIQKMLNDFSNPVEISDDYYHIDLNKIKSENPEMSSDIENFKLMIKYCNYLVESALEEYNNESK